MDYDDDRKRKRCEESNEADEKLLRKLKGRSQSHAAIASREFNLNKKVRALQDELRKAEIKKEEAVQNSKTMALELIGQLREENKILRAAAEREGVDVGELINGTKGP